MTPDIPQPTKVYAPDDEWEQSALLRMWLDARVEWVGHAEVWSWELDPAWADTEMADM
jgi:hypothetical protein